MSFTIDREAESTRLVFSNGERTHVLHPVWLRERTREADTIDTGSWQRLYDPSTLDLDLTAVQVASTASESVVTWSDGHVQTIDHVSIARELGWVADPNELPPAVAWAVEPHPFPRMPWPGDDDDVGVVAALESFWTHGFVVFTGTPTHEGSLDRLASRFGRVRETNFGALFDVFTKPNPVDLAYTPRELTPHTDNPYRRPVPGIQFLHCLKNDAVGGQSTLVDGLSAFDDFAQIDPEGHRALCSVPVTFRYHFGPENLASRSPILETGTDGAFMGIRNSDRLDFVDATDPDMLDAFYRGRRGLRRLLNDESRRALFLLQPGDLMMMDNRRLLHGRLSYQLESGTRHLQGCYIDLDGPELLWHSLQ